ncbi:DNA-binding response OmpR family regulator, partial [Mycoplana sp. BE70]|uniref:response regulator n=1 Tax=Mycoplana sp. BE70 TaxID=2817775 RepID=UPI002863AE01
TALLAGRRILVVEDEALIAMSIEDALVDAGAQVVGPSISVERALKSLQHEHVDAIVLDMNLNGTSARPIAEAASKRAIPFLVLSGYGAQAISEIPGNAPVLSKPFDPGELVDVIRKLVG